MTVHTAGDESEEWANALTHAIGFIGAMAGAAMVIDAAAQHGGPWQIRGCAVYGATLIAVYAFSTLSHIVSGAKARYMLRMLDQAMIFLFIAGSYTPIALAWLRTPTWWIFHSLLWAIAVAGFVSKIAFGHRVELGSVSTTIYIILGWMPMLAFWPMLQATPGALMFWIVMGGVCYSIGLVFFCYDCRIRYFHAAWHTLVMAGTLCHFIGIFHYCTAAHA